MIVTIEAPYKKATFTWDDALEECNVQAHGFSDEEFDAIMAAGGHEGADVDGYTVTIK